jgi:hypothetical protein
MIPSPETTAKVTVSRSRRFTTSKSDNLDYTTCSRVDSDLLSDLHTVLTSPTESSLLFVVQPEQQWTRSYSISSQSQHARGSFDFSTAKSVAYLAHKERRLSIPQTNGELSLKIKSCRYGCPQAVRASSTEAQHGTTTIAHRRLCKLLTSTKRRDRNLSLRPYVFLSIFSNRAKEKVSISKARAKGQEEAGDRSQIVHRDQL